jgi:hypothetical protein
MPVCELTKIDYQIISGVSSLRLVAKELTKQISLIEKKRFQKSHF